jgi:hypothetical protein
LPRRLRPADAARPAAQRDLLAAQVPLHLDQRLLELARRYGASPDLSERRITATRCPAPPARRSPPAG